jgi:hypothetical protein
MTSESRAPARFCRRLTYANVMSTVALFVALGGSSYAVTQIDGATLENRSVRAVKLARNTLGSAEIRESRLAKVPRADNADRLGGVSAAALRVRCPDGTFAVADVCVETAPRGPASYGVAVQTCLGIGMTSRTAGRRLPTHGELTAALAGVPLAAGGELTSEVYPSTSDAGGLDVLFVTDRTGRVGLTPNTGAGGRAFRCVADPLN